MRVLCCQLTIALCTLVLEEGDLLPGNRACELERLVSVERWRVDPLVDDPLEVGHLWTMFVSVHASIGMLSAGKNHNTWPDVVISETAVVSRVM